MGRFLLCLISLSMLTTTMVHAQEVPNAQAPTIECSGYVHSDGDADQTQGDADKGMPHHHGGCQGAPAFVPASASDDMLLRGERSCVHSCTDPVQALGHRPRPAPTYSLTEP
ncbi:hypothetical protein ACFSUK_13605 [Sphingobium scionense]